MGQDPQPPTMLPAHGRAELDLEMHTEPLLTKENSDENKVLDRIVPGAICV